MSAAVALRSTPAATKLDGRDSSIFDTDEYAVAPRLSMGEIVDRYRIGRVLGVGGHGVVYEAEHIELGYPVAIKVMERAAELDSRRRARFRRETLVGARVRHRNVVAILEAGALPDGSPYFVMEHIDGIELSALVARNVLTPAAVIDLGIQLAGALAALWECGIVHRDIKPHNVMVHRASDGSVEVKLLDLGICKTLRRDVDTTLTQDGFVLGTPHYMSPEQIRGEQLDVRSDLYAVASLLYEALTGQPPFDADNTEGLLTRILVEEPTPLGELRPDCPLELIDVIERAMHKQRDERYPSPCDFAEALREAAARLRLPQTSAAWTEQTETPDGNDAPRHPLRLVKGLATASEAERLLPTPAACPSAIRLRRPTPRFRPPWWPAVALAVAVLIVGLVSIMSIRLPL